jgi:hypothetical protein
VAVGRAVRTDARIHIEADVICAHGSTDTVDRYTLQSAEHEAYGEENCFARPERIVADLRDNGYTLDMQARVFLVPVLTLLLLLAHAAQIAPRLFVSDSMRTESQWLELASRSGLDRQTQLSGARPKFLAAANSRIFRLGSARST